MTPKTFLMRVHIPPLFSTVIDICRFQRGPQDLPHSVVALSVSLTVYTVARILVGLFTLPAEIAALSGLIDTTLLTLTLVVALWIRRLCHRAVQTLMGCFAVGSVVSLLTITGYSLVTMAPVPLLVLGVGHALTFPLILWNLALNTHILREALSTGLAMAFFVAFAYLVILWQVTEYLVKVALPH